MALTEEDRKKKIDHFRDLTKMVDEEDDFADDPWTQEAILEVGKKILGRIKRDEKLQ